MLNRFTVHQPGVLHNGNMLLLIDFEIMDQLDKNLGKNIYDELENIGVNVNDYQTIIVDNMENEEYILRLIRNYPGVKYFLMIGRDPKFNEVMKLVKLKSDIRGNYKDHNKINDPGDIRKLCLEINRQCRGINYSCPLNFPRDTAFVHFILCDGKISCATNATKFEEPHVMVTCTIDDETTYVQVLEKLCSKLTGKLQDKCIKNFVVTFENFFTTLLSKDIAEIMYEVVSKWIAKAKIGVAEIILKKNFRTHKNTIIKCLAIKYDNGINSDKKNDGELDSGEKHELDSDKILELLERCKNCNDLRLNVDEETALPEHIKLAIINYKNVIDNSKKLPVKPSQDNDVNDLVLPDFTYPNIKHRNHIIIPEDEDFALV